MYISINDKLKLFYYSKRTCSIGINSHFCSLADLDSKLRSREWLSSIYGPGKRSGTRTNQDMRNTEDEEEIHR